MRFFFYFMLIAFAMSLLIVGCKKTDDKIEPPTTPPLTQLKFTPEKTTLELGKTAEVTIVGTLKTTDKVKIANEEIVALQGAVTDNKIKLLAKKVGITQVQILTAEGKERGRFEVIVTPIFKLSFTPEALSFELGKTAEVTIVGTLNTTDKVQIADEAVVALQGAITDNKINLLAKKIGTTKVSILSAEGKERGAFEVTVTPVFELHFTPETSTVEVGKTTEVTIIGNPNTTDKVQIADGTIVALQGAITDNKINLLAKKIGTTKVSILSAEGKERGAFEVTVTPVFELHFTPETSTVEVGKTTEVTIIGNLNTTDKVQIADETIVALQGTITDNKVSLLAKKIGTTKVSILTTDNKERGTFEVTVTPKLLLSFSPAKVTIEQEKTATVTFSGVWNDTDKVRIANEAIVTLHGKVTDNKINLLAKGIGTTQVQVLTADGQNRGSFEVTVTPKLLLSFSPAKITIEQEKTATVTFSGVWNDTDKVRIANEAIVSLHGKVTDNKINLLAKGIGTTQVQVLTADGQNRGSFEVTVTPKLLLSFSPAKITIEQEKTATVTFSGVWNDTDKVRIANEAIVSLHGKVTDNKINLLAKGIGTTQVQVLTADGRERGAFEVKVTPKLLLSFTPAKVVIKKAETTTVTFSGVWNASDRVQIVNDAIVSLQGEVTNNKINLLANKVGTTKVHVYTVDGQDRGGFEVVVYEEPKKMTLPYKTNIPHYKTEITSKEEYKRLIEETLRTYESLKRELEALDKYPLDKYRYNDQNALYLEGIRISRAAKQYYKDNKDTADLRNLKNTYENLHQYGIGYTEVEIMVRLAEQYRKEFPNNTEIENIIKENFNGEYGNLDGPILTNYLNNNIVKAFNNIIDIVNRLK